MKKTRKITLIAIFSVLVLGLLGVGGYLLYNNLTGSQTGNLAGVEWYSETEKEFTISTADELFELAKLSEYYDFKGQKVKLGADIVINEGNAKDWNLEAPARKWNPILQFAGTFDGQGHTISGMYAVGYMESVGMFAGTQRGCVIKNFKLVNSFFKNNGDMGTGSILAKGGGTIDTVYSDAIVVSTGWHSGGLVGTFTASGSNKITNCWFDGTLTMEMEYGRYAGGILGTVNALGGKNTIEHCLNSGTITTAATSNPCIGGICGVVMANGSLQLTDNLNVGMITTERGIYGIGSILGRVVGKTTMVTIEENYASSESYYTALGGSEGNLSGTSVRIRNVNLVGYEGYQWTELDFDKYWAVVMDDTPVLQSFTDTIVDLDGIAKKIDKSWYVSTLKEFTLTTPAQLFGFAELSRTIDFKGVTIKLGADIVCNEGNASDWAKEAPINIWKPIGYNAEFGGKTFLGTFDGQGHTISGLYGLSTKSMVSFFGETGAGSIVKNLKITNSYFEAQIAKSDSWGMVGGVVAKSWGTVDTVYSNAILVNSGTVTGGIVGMMRITGKDGGECTVRNCWYDGKITANGSTGGIVGDIYGCPTTVEHCLNTGSISTIKASGNIGGLVGIVEIQDAKLNLSDSVSVGKISDASKKSWNVGSAIGRVVKTEKVTNIVANLKNVYVSKEASGNALGNKTGNFTGTDIVRLAEADLIGTNGYFNTALSFYANGKGYWVAQTDKTPVLKSFAKGKTLAVGGLRADISWYSKDKDVYTIKNAGQLYGLRLLSESLDFKGKTIKLANDIVVNEGNASTWAEAAPTYSWRPIGYNEEFGGKTFQGTFDGQGYSISGLYGKTTKSMMSLFGEIGTNGVIKNLKVTNSYFEAEKTKSDSWGMVAGVVAKSWGTVDTVYSNATLVNNGTVTGGIVGMMRITGKVEGKCMVSNCWYDGVITANGSIGGIIGCVYGCEATIEHCLYTGKTSTIQACGNVGGLCGIVEQKNGVLNISDSLSLGSIKDASVKSWNMGSILGRAVKTETTNTVVNIENVYAAKEIGAYTIGNKTGNFNGDDIVVLPKAELTGELSYLKTQLSFYVANKNETGKWVVMTDGTPVLKSFAQPGAMDLTNALCADTSWYDKEPYEISTVSQLYGFAELSKTTDFAGKTITLTASLTLNENEGNAETWGTNAPKYSWTPIEDFAGIFNGNMNTISGIYLKSSETGLGLFKEVSGTVQNLVVENSYIENTKTSGTSATGSVVGSLSGTLHTVKSGADVVLNGSEYAGGLVGDVTQAGAKIENCWFAGSVSGKGNHHGTLLGGVHNTGATADINACLSTGTIDLRSNAGGLVGTLWNNSKLNLTDSLFIGTFVTGFESSPSNVGTAIANARNGVATVDKVYIKEVSEVNVKVGNKGSNTDKGVIVLTANDLTGAVSYLKTQLGFYIANKNETGKWSVCENEMPVLKSFANAEGIDLTNAIFADTSWYDAEPYEISTPSQFYGFAELSKTTDFAGKTIKLVKDIEVNTGDAGTWGANAPKYSWTPIENFAGTFDGGKYTISGIYLKSNEECLGLFKEVSGTVQNVVLENSYIENTMASGKGATGSVVGRLSGTLHTVKSSADVVLNGSEYAGGLVGDITTAGAKIENSWFAGSVSGTGSHHGTLLGGLHETGAEGTIINCLSTGKIDARANAGGMVGAAWSNTKLTIKESLYVGEFVSISGVNPWNIGTVLGNAKKNTTTATNVYVGNDSVVGSVIGSNESSSNSTAAIYKLERATQLTGNAAYGHMNVDFYEKDKNETGVWFAMADNYPVLTSFADTSNPIDLTTAQGCRTYWFDPDNKQTSYTLYSPAELCGFQALAATENFHGIEIKLGKDIDLNPGWTAGSGVPTNVWTPIGRSVSDTSVIVPFRGTFNGDGHTIKGVYVSSASDRIGLFATSGADAKIQNFTLENSVINSTKTSSTGSVGSIVGRLGGTLDTVKSSADVVLAGSEYAGGLVGDINSTVGATITNCWFAGTVSGTGSHHGQLLGGVRKVLTSDTKVTCTIKNCLATGTIDFRSNAGGLVGTLWTGSTLTMTETLFAGTFKTGVASSSSNNGTVIGNARNGSATVTNVYVKEGSNVSTKIGNKGSNVDTGVTNLANNKLLGNAAFGNMNVDFYEKGKNETGVWYAMADSHPVLTSFADTSNPIDLTTAQGVRTYWFDAENPKTSYTLSSPAEFRGLQALAATEDFYGIEIKLDNNIDLNPGWTAGATAPSNVWTPIGRLATDSSVIKPFRGTFNGQGHTIKGVYVNSSADRIGLFASTGANAIVKNFTLENSYINSTKTSSTGSVGSIVGRLGGTLDSVKSSADVVLAGSEYAGGLVGDINSTVGATITNCWFAGTVSGTGSHHGQLLGGVRKVLTSDTKVTCTIKNCLATGTIDFRSNAGGLVGTLWTGSTLTMTETLFAGTFKTGVASSSSNNGTVIGNARNGSATVTNVYVKEGSNVSTKIGNKGSNVDTGVTNLANNKLLGTAAYDNMSVDFYQKDTNEDGVWYAVEGSHPVLKSFVK